MKGLHRETSYSRRKLKPEIKKQEELENIGVLSFIQPARELLQGNCRFNSVYVNPISSLPPIMQSSEDFYPLAPATSNNQIFLKRKLYKKIFQKNMKLTINPLQTRMYFKNYRTNKITSKQFVKQLTSSKIGQLAFDSNFQSGNLLRAQAEPLEHIYHLTMQNDINTYGCTQWFFFKASNQQKCKATFFINNFYKNKSLYQKGMKILMFSKKKSIQQGLGWIRGGQQICYFKNYTSENISQNTSKNFYSLKFSYHFQYEEDEVYFAYNYPYTYSRLNSFLNQKLSKAPNFMTNRILCKTIADNKVFLITITDLSISKNEKKSVFISARVHPGQTVSSLMMQGIIQFLVSNSDMAQRLRQMFIFKIVPMLNPDGVIHGNYRTNLAGFDLNRVWSNPDKELCPQIFQLKKYITEFHKICPMLMFCDLHGHSSKKSAFFYGCAEQDKITRKKKININQEVKLFPFMLSKTSADCNFKFCDFSVKKNKQGTARVQLWKQLKIPNIFTLQASFCSREDSQFHFRPKDYQDIGHSFCVTLYQYFCDNQKKEVRKNQMKQTLEFFTKQGFKKQQSSDSESDTDLLDQKIRKNISMKNTNFQLPQRTFIYNQQQRSPAHEFSQKKVLNKESPKKYIRKNRSEINYETDKPKTKIVHEDFPLNKVSIETQWLKNKQMKFPQNRRRLYTENSVLQRVDHTYRGKSSLYRIKRRGQLISIEPQKKSSVYRLDYFS